MVPKVVTHYHLRDRRPFLNLSDVPEGSLADVLAGLERDRPTTGNRRTFGRRYIELRSLTEARLRELFEARGGRPERRSPHYFVLGRSAWFEGLAAEMDRVELPLASLPEAQTTITYPDSFVSMGFGPSFGVPHTPQPHHGKVFLLSELRGLVERYGLPDDRPDDDYPTYVERPVDRFIEVQLWTDDPLSRHLRPADR